MSFYAILSTVSSKKLIVVAHANLGSSLSGGDRIFLNLIRYWQSKFDITLLASQETFNLARRFKIKPQHVIKTASLSPVTTLNTINLFFHHLIRFFSGAVFCLTHSSIFKTADFIYTSSDFYADFVFGLLAKLNNPKIKWLCGYYLLAPNPLDPKSPYQTNHRFFRGLIYYLAQIPSVYLAKHLADFVFVTSVPDQKTFLPKPSIVVQGGVSIPSTSVLHQMKPIYQRQFDALFIGRLHTQKGVVELIDIWKLVVKTKPQAKLAIIGDGELKDTIVKKISKLKLTKNIHLAGFQVGPKKFKLIKNSKLILHPATYDSGGMAAAEAMAYGLPGVSYDLPALKTYYPQGMLKVSCFNQKEFSNTILKLISQPKLYHQTSIEARHLILNHWGWNSRLNQIYRQIIPGKISK